MEKAKDSKSSESVEPNKKSSTKNLPNKSDQEYQKITEELVQLKHEKNTLKKNLDKKKEDFDKLKEQYQALMKTQTEQINKFEDEISDRTIQRDEYSNKYNQTMDKLKKLEIDKPRWEIRMSELGKENKELQIKVENLENLSEDKSKVIEVYQENLMRHEDESAGLARKLAELKNAVSYMCLRLDD